MRVFMPVLSPTETYPLLLDRAKASRQHVLVEHPGEADLVLILATLSDRPELLLESDLYRDFADKCVAYQEADAFLPLLPGVYCSAEKSRHTEVGRVFSYAYATGNGRFSNTHVQPQPDARKKWLVSFQGGSTSLLRKRLYRVQYGRDDILIENTSAYMHWLEERQADHQQRQRSYAQTMAESHFVLCPRGAGVGTIRLFEVMKAGVAPVLMSDRYVLPPGVDWDKFLVRVRERDLRRLPQILEPLRESAAERGRLAREAYLQNFSEDVEFDRIVDLCQRALQHGPPAEAQFRRQVNSMLKAERRRTARYDFMKAVALRAMKLLRIKNPYQMNER